MIVYHEARTSGRAGRYSLAHKDALFVRSHYDGMTIMLPDAPLEDGFVSSAVSLIGAAQSPRRRAQQGRDRRRRRTEIGNSKMKSAIVNLKTIVSGDWRKPFAKGDAILMNNGKITKVGTLSAKEEKSCDVVLDAGGMTAMPGLIDSQVHVAFADYTPRQRTIGFLESYLHGGVTTSISASEVHVPGRPSIPTGWWHSRCREEKLRQLLPGGMHVIRAPSSLNPIDPETFQQRGDRAFGWPRLVSTSSNHRLTTNPMSRWRKPA